LAYLRGSKPVKKINIYLWLGAGLLFASITEIYQIIIPGRTYNPVDLGLNITGILAGIPLGKWIFSRKIFF
jgi:VanZ family protein